MPDEAKLAAVIKGAGGRRADRVRGHRQHARRSSRRCPSPAPLRRPRPRPPGITEWTLSNGVRVVLEPTTFKQDEILFRAFSPGGTSLASDQDYVAAETARPDRVRGRTRHALGHRRRQEARGQDRRRTSRHRRDVRGAERPGPAARSRNDVSADLPDVHAAARRCGSVSRGDGPAERRAGEPPGAARRRVRRRAQRGGHARITCARGR